MRDFTLPVACLCLFSGALLGGLYLLMKLVRLLLRGGRLCAALLDVAFCLTAAVVAFLCALVVDKGRLRLVQAFLQALGAWSVVVALDPLVGGIAAWVRKAGAWLRCLLARPFRAVGRFFMAKYGKRRQKRLEKKRAKRRKRPARRRAGPKIAGKAPKKSKKSGVKRKKRKKPLEKLM